jgi:hypothetical protein
VCFVSYCTIKAHLNKNKTFKNVKKLSTSAEKFYNLNSNPGLRIS